MNRNVLQERIDQIGERPTAGPLPLLQKHVEGATLYADRDAALVHLPKFCNFAEIGVGYGGFSEEVKKVLRPSLFDAYDLFQWHHIPVIWGKPSADTLKGKTHREFYEGRFAADIREARMRVFEGDSSTLMENQPDRFYDVIYVDGDHELEGVWRDAQVAMRKLKDDGYLIFNDYIMFDQGVPYGIVQVANFLCVKLDWRVEYFALHGGMYCDMCVRRKGAW
jgi:hypothetical protein